MKSLDMARLTVYVSQEVHPIYEKLTSRSSKNVDSFPFETMKDLFIASACLGAKYGRFIEFKGGKEIVEASIFNPKTEIPVLISLAFYKTGDLETLSDSRLVLDIVQGWANGGIHFLEEQLLGASGRPLFNLANYLLQERQGS